MTNDGPNRLEVGKAHHKGPGMIERKENHEGARG